MKAFEFPDGKRFAFAIIDDTDVATVDNVKPVYELLSHLGMKATKTVWPVACPEGSEDYSNSQTLEDEEYLNFVKDLKKNGFEISWHGATMESSQRERTKHALDKYFEAFGEYPRIHVNHGYNQENLYWGDKRVDNPILKLLYRKASWRNHGYYLGDQEQSPFWWGDYASKYFMYARNLTFNDIHTSKYNRSMPYKDKKRPLVPWWFSTSDADDAHKFNELINPDNQLRLENEGGFCIVSTHFGKDFVVNGKLNDEFKSRLEMLSKREGWFPNTGELLDWLREQRQSSVLPKIEWTKMQFCWAKDVIMQRLHRN